MCAYKGLILSKTPDMHDKKFGISQSMTKAVRSSSLLVLLLGAINLGITLWLLSPEGQRFLSTAWTAAALSQSTSLQKWLLLSEFTANTSHTHKHTHRVSQLCMALHPKPKIKRLICIYSKKWSVVDWVNFFFLCNELTNVLLEMKDNVCTWGFLLTQNYLSPQAPLCCVQCLATVTPCLSKEIQGFWECLE